MLFLRGQSTPPCLNIFQCKAFQRLMARDEDEGESGDKMRRGGRGTAAAVGEGMWVIWTCPTWENGDLGMNY